MNKLQLGVAISLITSYIVWMTHTVYTVSKQIEVQSYQITGINQALQVIGTTIYLPKGGE